VIPAELLRRLGEIDTATITNALDRLEGDVDDTGYQFSSMELRCHLPELTPVVGYAVTCTGDSTSPRGHATSPRNATSVNRMRALYEAVRDSPKPVIVVCQNVGVDRYRSNHFGDLMATTFQRLGAVAAVTDGGIRDLAGIRERAPGFQMYSPGFVASGGVSSIVDIGVTVSVCGMVIAPGDLLHGDANGLVVIPTELAAGVPEKAEAIFEKERARVEFVRSDEFSVEELARRAGW
jgi:regulator of RNase E activity RraA